MSRRRPKARRLVLVVVAAVAVSGCGLSYEDFEGAVDLAVEQGTVRMEGEVVVSERVSA